MIVMEPKNNAERKVDNAEVDNADDLNNQQEEDKYADSSKSKLPNVAILGDSILNNIEGRGISKQGNVKVNSFSGATLADMKHHIIPTISQNAPDVIILHIGSNDLTKGGDTIDNIQGIINKITKSASHTKVVLSSLLIRRDKNNIEKHVNELNAKLKTLADDNLIDYIDNANIDESCFGQNNFTLTRKERLF